MEPDLVSIGKNVSIEGALQTHLFEERVMRLSTVTIQDDCGIGRESSVLYDSEMRVDSHLGELSLIMNNETFVENNSYHRLPAENISPQSVAKAVRYGATFEQTDEVMALLNAGSKLSSNAYPCRSAMLSAQ